MPFADFVVSCVASDDAPKELLPFLDSELKMSALRCYKHIILHE